MRQARETERNARRIGEPPQIWHNYWQDKMAEQVK